MPPTTQPSFSNTPTSFNSLSPIITMPNITTFNTPMPSITNAPITNIPTTMAPTTAAPISTPAPTTTTPAPTTTTPAPTPASNVYIPPVGNNSAASWVNTVFNATTMTIAFWIFAIYISVYFLKAIYAPRSLSAESSGQLTYSRTVDFILGLSLIGLFSYAYWQMSSSSQSNIMGFMLNWTYNFFNDPSSLLESIVFTFVFFLLVYLLRVPMSPDVKPVLVHLVEHKIWILYACFLFIFFFKYALNIPIVDIIFNNQYAQYLENLPTGSTPGSSPSFWSNLASYSSTPVSSMTYSSTPSTTPGSTTSGSTTPGSTTSGSTPMTSPSTSSGLMAATNSIGGTPSCSSPNSTPAPNMEVFNIGNNNYTYENAKAVCHAYGAELADYSQIENSYNNGGEWCNYGWSANQMAYFPTQKSTWKTLQQNEKTKNACGRPGVNGGFIDNPYVKFGANCYGVKPPATPGWAPKSPLNILPPQSTPASVNPQDQLDAQLKKQALVNSFNNNEWSRY